MGRWVEPAIRGDRENAPRGLPDARRTPFGDPRTDPPAQPPRHRHRPPLCSNRSPRSLDARPSGHLTTFDRPRSTALDSEDEHRRRRTDARRGRDARRLSPLSSGRSLESLISQGLDLPENQRVRATKAMADSLCQLVRIVWEAMKLAGEAGSLLKIEEELTTRRSRRVVTNGKRNCRSFV